MSKEYFKEYSLVEDKINPFTYHYVIDENVDFYIERVFMTKLRNLIFLHIWFLISFIIQRRNH